MLSATQLKVEEIFNEGMNFSNKLSAYSNTKKRCAFFSNSTKAITKYVSLKPRFDEESCKD
jgi:hypothetical protein